jgi:hypothetical protein
MTDPTSAGASRRALGEVNVGYEAGGRLPDRVSVRGEIWVGVAGEQHVKDIEIGDTEWPVSIGEASAVTVRADGRGSGVVDFTSRIDGWELSGLIVEIEIVGAEGSRLSGLRVLSGSSRGEEVRRSFRYGGEELGPEGAEVVRVTWISGVEWEIVPFEITGVRLP